jgi:nucleoside-diphosphate-sugar epimerase
MRFLVTGASGFIGNRLAQALLWEFNTDGNEFIFVARSRCTEFLKTCLGNSRVRVVHADVADLDSIAPLFTGVDYVFHAAAKVDYGCPDTQEYYRTNVDGSSNVFDLCRANRVKRVINISTAGIFHPSGNTVVNETTPLTEKQTTRYTHSKYLAYLRSLEFIRQGVPFINILPSAVFGEGSPLFAPLLRDLALGRPPILPDLKHRFSLLYVGDFVEGMLRAFRYGSPGESYCFSGQSRTLRELVHDASEVLGRRAKVVCMPYPVDVVIVIVS